MYLDSNSHKFKVKLHMHALNFLTRKACKNLVIFTVYIILETLKFPLQRKAAHEPLIRLSLPYSPLNFRNPFPVFYSYSFRPLFTSVAVPVRVLWSLFAYYCDIGYLHNFFCSFSPSPRSSLHLGGKPATISRASFQGHRRGLQRA